MVHSSFRPPDSSGSHFIQDIKTGVADLVPVFLFISRNRVRCDQWIPRGLLAEEGDNAALLHQIPKRGRVHTEIEAPGRQPERRTGGPPVGEFPPRPTLKKVFHKILTSVRAEEIPCGRLVRPEVKFFSFAVHNVFKNSVTRIDRVRHILDLQEGRREEP